jgi:hypothetical protein
MSNMMPRPSTPLDGVGTPKPLSKLLGSMDEVRSRLGLVKCLSCFEEVGPVLAFSMANLILGNISTHVFKHRWEILLADLLCAVRGVL